MSRPAKPPSSTATLRRRCSVARNRASMREGPLADLFRATEAAQRQAPENEQQELPTEPPLTPAPVVVEPAPRAEKPEPVPAPTPIRSIAPAPEQPAEERRPLARWLDPLPDQPA